MRRLGLVGSVPAGPIVHLTVSSYDVNIERQLQEDIFVATATSTSWAESRSKRDGNQVESWNAGKPREVSVMRFESAGMLSLQDFYDRLAESKIVVARRCGCSVRSLFLFLTVLRLKSCSLVCGHEFIGTVVSLGSSFNTTATDRPPLYSSLSIDDEVISPFTVSCGECQ